MRAANPTRTPLSPSRATALLAVFGLALASAHTARAADASPEPSVIRVHGEGRITIEPDLAEIEIGVVTEAASAASAAAQNAQRVERVLEALRSAVKGDKGARIETVRYTLEPRYRFPKGGGSASIEGFVARNSVRVRTRLLDTAGSIIDAATSAGANQIERLEFRLDEPEVAHSRALREAALQARSRAAAIASALGLRVRRVRSVESGRQALPVPPIRADRVRMMGAGAATPIEPGAVQVRESLTMEVEVSE